MAEAASGISSTLGGVVVAVVVRWRHSRCPSATTTFVKAVAGTPVVAAVDFGVAVSVVACCLGPV